MDRTVIEFEQMRILYVGARIVGHRVLEALLKFGANITGVLTLDERRKEVTSGFCLFDDFADSSRFEMRTFSSLKDKEHVEWARKLQPDLGIVVGVSQLIGEELLSVPPRGFLGMHPTLLPEGRGRAPIPWALIKGLKRTGVSIFYCDPGVDTGDLVAQKEVPIYYEDDSSTLGGRTDGVVIELLKDVLPKIAAGTATRFSQDTGSATVWPRRRPEDGVIDWRWNSRQLYDWVRALTHPYPGAFTFLGGKRLNVWAARETRDDRRGVPGEILAVVPHGVLVATGDGALLLTDIEWDGSAGAEGRSGLAVGKRFSGF